MFKIELVYAGDMLNGMMENNPNLVICTAILKDLNLRVERHVCDRDRVMRLSKGLVSPVNGFVFVIRPQQVLENLPKDETIILNYFELIKFIEDRAYRQISSW